MNILVTGALGQLGTAIRSSKKPKNGIYFYADLFGDPKTNGIDKLDITNQEDVAAYIDKNKIDIIINCAAYTNVEGAETNEQNAYILNAIAPSILADEIKKRNGWLIHISTDYVFGTEQYNTPCTEDMNGTPLGVYGHTKKQGEIFIMASGCKYIIIRTSWLYCEYGKNFCKTITDGLIYKKNLRVVEDQVGTPTYAKDLADAIITINNNFITKSDAEKYVGIYHYSNEGVCSWYDFACEIRNNLILSDDDPSYGTVSPCHSSEYPSKVKRPSYSVLDKTKIKNTFELEIPHWRDSLELCMDKILIQMIIDEHHKKIQ